MARTTIADAAKGLYLALHTVTLDAEAGKSLTAEQLSQAQGALSKADNITQLRELAYPAGSDLV